MTEEKHYVSYLTVPQTYSLNQACQALKPFGLGTFHVGSSLASPDYHDVDLRCILHDDEYDRMFGSQNEDGAARLSFLNAAISEWLSKRVGLPIDFQFQQFTDANEKYQGRRNGIGF